MKNKVLPSVVILFLSLGIFLGFSIMDDNPNSSRTQEPVQFESIPLSPAPHYVAPDAIIFEDSLNGANDTTALKSRGYLPYYRGSGSQGVAATWFQGNSTVFSAFNGPSTGYVAANYQVVTSINNIDSWLVLPVTPVAAGDTLSFYERGTTSTTWVDSMRVMYSSVGDSTPEGTWTELGRFMNTDAGWFNRIYTVPTAGPNGRFALRYCVVNGGPSGSNSDYIGVDWIRVYGSGSGPSPGPVPDILYYKFEDNPGGNTVTNYAIPGQGTNPAPLSGAITLTSGGQFDSCIIGTTGANNGGVVTGWNNSLGSGNWTISTWVNIPHSTTGLAYYLFGDPAGSFRCFHNGVAGPDNLMLRGTGITNVTVAGVGPTPTVVHFVYDSAAAEIRTYKNGVYNTTVSQTPLNLAAGSGFKVGGYSTTRTMRARIDEFRVYSRALDTTEITSTWNHQLPLVTGIPTPVLNIPDKFILSQNYPNPFNPTTTIDFKVPVNELVTLKVYDVTGKEVTTLINEVKNAGTHSIEFNATGLSSGVYFYKIVAGDFMNVKKMVLLK